MRCSKPTVAYGHNRSTKSPQNTNVQYTHTTQKSMPSKHLTHPKQSRGSPRRKTHVNPINRPANAVFFFLSPAGAPTRLPACFNSHANVNSQRPHSRTHRSLNGRWFILRAASHERWSNNFDRVRHSSVPDTASGTLPQKTKRRPPTIKSRELSRIPRARSQTPEKVT